MSTAKIIAELVETGHEDLAQEIVKAITLTPKLQAALLNVLKGYIGSSDWNSIIVKQFMQLPNVFRISLEGRYLILKRATQKLKTKWAQSKGFTVKLIKVGDEGSLTVDIPITAELEQAAEQL